MNRRAVLIAVLGLALNGAVFGQTGIITTIAGSWASAFSGDNGPATSAQLDSPNAVAVDSRGNIYISDNAYFFQPTQTGPVQYSSRVRKVDAQTGIITTFAGNGTPGFSGDGGPATSAAFYNITALAVDGAGRLFIADSGNNRIRRVDANTGIVTTVVGGGTDYPGDGGPATSAALGSIGGLAIDSSGNLYESDAYVTGAVLFSNEYDSRVRRIEVGTGIITTVAGNATSVHDCPAFSGDGGPATSATLCQPGGLAVDGNGNLYIADSQNGRVRKVDASTGTINTVAGNGTHADNGDGGLGTNAALVDPVGLAVDAAGNLYVSDSPSARVRMLAATTGIITTVAGTGCSVQPAPSSPAGCFGGDGGPAVNAGLDYPTGLAMDSNGNLYIADTYNNRIREVFYSSRPAITSLSPSSAPSGSAALTLTVTGINFNSGSTVNWSGSPLTTTFVSATQMSALVPADLLANAGAAGVTVTDPPGVISNAIAFAISQAGVPIITALSPGTDPPQFYAGFTMAVFGTGFNPGAVVIWGGTPLATTFVSSTGLLAAVPANLVPPAPPSPTTLQVSVQNPGGPASNSVRFPGPSSQGATLLTYILPGVVTAGGPDLIVNLYGLGFGRTSTVYWNGVPLNTSYISSTQLTATIPANLTANAGSAIVNVVTPPYGGFSTAVVFPVANALSFTNALRIAHIADSAGWTTTFIIENIDAVPVNFGFNFWADDGTALPIQVVNADGGPGYPSGSLEPGHSYFLQSTGTSPSLLQGWAEVASSGKLGVLALFNYTGPGVPQSQGTVIGQTSASAISMPYDNTQGYVMGVALANSNPTQALTVGMTFLTDRGAQFNGQITIPPHGHTAFVLANDYPVTAGTRGAIQFTTTSPDLPDLSVLGERFSPSLSFTSVGTFQQ